MTTVCRKVEFRIFIKIFSSNFCAVVGLNIVKFFTVGGMDSFKFAKCFLFMQPVCYCLVYIS